MGTGILLGGTLQLIVLGWMNIGAAQSPDSALASMISTLLVIQGHFSIGEGIALAIPLAVAGQMLTILTRTITVFFQHWADREAERGSFRGIDWAHLLALLVQGLRVAIPTLIVALLAGTTEVTNLLNAIPHVITMGLEIAGGFIVVVGYAMVIRMMRANYLMPFFFLGFVLAAFSNFNLVAFGVIGLALALIYLQLNPKYHPTMALAGSGSISASEDFDRLDEEND
jgi:PTS system mannose-specific IIC component